MRCEAQDYMAFSEKQLVSAAWHAPNWQQSQRIYYQNSSYLLIADEG